MCTTHSSPYRGVSVQVGGGLSLTDSRRETPGRNMRPVSQTGSDIIQKSSCGQTDTCKNITLPQTSFAGGKNKNFTQRSSNRTMKEGTCRWRFSCWLNNTRPGIRRHHLPTRACAGEAVLAEGKTHVGTARVIFTDSCCRRLSGWVVNLEKVFLKMFEGPP